ncbi:unnamed protein product [Pleuronectes platessa]|uniref:Uncharacterized protein n=1 Tax=Pleuronectes platessa TaxID=8262 RepID=A0A9N7VPL5_PLEPL|nr:unnamed protein product [Pleuronectes platessa]
MRTRWDGPRCNQSPVPGKVYRKKTASPLTAVSPAGTRPSRLYPPHPRYSSPSDWRPGGRSCLSVESPVQGLITSSMPSQFPLTVSFQTGFLKFSVRAPRPKHGQSQTLT